MALPLPSTLTPSKLSKFASCPLAFRFSYIDQLPEPPTTAQVRGTLVHRALELLYADGPAEQRTPARGGAALAEATAELDGRGEFTPLELDAAGMARLVQESRRLVESYFAIEDPAAVSTIGTELDLRTTLGDVALRGIIDRLDELPSGEVVVVDYKTGRAPRPEHSRSRLVGVQFYAFLCEQVLGRRPSEVRLMYLADQVVVVESPTDQTMRGLRQRALAVWAAIERACATEDFRPNPSPLCRYCAFQVYCPAFGGDPSAAVPAL